MELIQQEQSSASEAETTINPEHNQIKEIGKKLTNTGEKLLEYSANEAETKDLIPVLIAAGLIQLGVAASLSGHANALMELSANMTLPQRLTHLGMSEELANEATQIRRFAAVLPALAIIEAAVVMVGSKVEEFNEKIGLRLKELPVSTVVYPAAAKSLMYVGKLINS